MRRMMLIGIGLALFALPAAAQDKKRPDVLTPGKTGVFTLAFSPDGKKLASGLVGMPPKNALNVWDAATRQLKASMTGHTGHIFHASFSADGTTLATASFDKTVRLWDVESGKEKAIVLRDEVQAKAIRYSADGNSLGVATHKRVRILDAATGKETRSVGIHPEGAGHCFNPTLELMAFAPDWWYIHLIDTTTGKTKILLTGLKGATRAIAFSRDGKSLASASNDGLRVWDVAAGKLKVRFAIDSGRCVALSPDGKIVAYGMSEGRVRIWDVATSKELPSLQDRSLVQIFCIAFHPDGKSLAAGGMGKIRFWDLPKK